MDSFAARSLRTIAHMTRLRGADTVIVGLQPEVAFAMVQLGLMFDDMYTALDLEEGLALLNRQLGWGNRSDSTVADDVIVDVGNPDDIVAARQAGHQLARKLGFSLTDVTMIATAISEVARNITSYAGYGAIRVAVQDREGRQALVVRAEDDGPGIANIERAMEDGYSTGRGLGTRLARCAPADGPFDRGIHTGAGHEDRDVEVDSEQWLSTGGWGRSNGRRRGAHCPANPSAATGRSRST